MPTKRRGPDKALIQLFLSAYEGRSWKDSDVEYPDEMKDGAVDLRATRSSDGKTLAIEHTLVQPFDDKETFPGFEREFLPIEQDQSLIRAGCAVYIDVPVSVLKKGQHWKMWATALHEWLRESSDRWPELIGHSGIRVIRGGHSVNAGSSEGRETPDSAGGASDTALWAPRSRVYC